MSRRSLPPLRSSLVIRTVEAACPVPLWSPRDVLRLLNSCSSRARATRSECPCRHIVAGLSREFLTLSRLDELQSCPLMGPLLARMTKVHNLSYKAVRNPNEIGETSELALFVRPLQPESSCSGTGSNGPGSARSKSISMAMLPVTFRHPVNIGAVMQAVIAPSRATLPRRCGFHQLCHLPCLGTAQRHHLVSSLPQLHSHSRRRRPRSSRLFGRMLLAYHGAAVTVATIPPATSQQAE